MVRLTYIPESIARAVGKRGNGFDEWSTEGLTLGTLLERGEIYQRIGQDFVPLKMIDIDSFLVSPAAGRDKLRLLRVPVSMRMEIDRYRGGVEDFVRRSLNFRMRAEKLPLYRLHEGKFVEINLSP